MTLAEGWDLMSQLGNLEEIRSKFEGHPGDFLHKIVSHG